MKDREFLIWIHERLQHVHKESALVDYMHKLRAIIRDYPKDKETINTGQSENSLEVLLKEIGK